MMEMYWTMLISRVKKTHENIPLQQLVSNKDAFEAFQTCKSWMEQQEEANSQQIMLLQQLMQPERGLPV